MLKIAGRSDLELIGLSLITWNKLETLAQKTVYFPYNQHLIVLALILVNLT